MVSLEVWWNVVSRLRSDDFELSLLTLLVDDEGTSDDSNNGGDDEDDDQSDDSSRETRIIVSSACDVATNVTRWVLSSVDLNIELAIFESLGIIVGDGALSLDWACGSQAEY